MSSGWKDEAREAVQKDWWRWLPGMRVVCAIADEDDQIPGRVHGGSVVYTAADGCLMECAVQPSDVPDLTDPATVGCLRAEVERLCAERDWRVQWDMRMPSEPVGDWSGLEDAATIVGALMWVWRIWPEPYENANHSMGGLKGMDPAAASGQSALRALTWLHEVAK